MLQIVKEKLKNKSQIVTTYLVESIRLRKIVEHKDRLIHVHVSCSDHKFSILHKYPSAKGTRIFINKEIILVDEVELSRFKW